MSGPKPTLWHIAISHYSEKVRWALDYKSVEHERRAPPPGAHMLVSLWLSRGRSVTFPVLELDGERIPDSTAIIAALEERYPEPPLYPADPTDRGRALALEDWFDEQLGPQIRRFVFHELGKDRERFAEIAATALPEFLPRRSVGAFARGFTAVRFGAAGDKAALAAREKLLAALDRLEAELQPSGYLVGDSFSVADLTAAALLYPLVLPPEGPLAIEDQPSRLVEFRAPLLERPGYRWVAEMFRRHRKRGQTEASRPAVQAAV